MRLLKATSINDPSGLELVNFSPSSVPPYAILSHTWGHEEVLLEHVLNRTADQRAAYQKCRYACEQALDDGFEYVWIDTCCIDKSSSAELSEAINSMFDWYHGSAVCYAYVQDYQAEKGGCGALSDSKWFTRGWTLQELLAPTRVLFYAAGWNEVGTRNDLARDLARSTKININILTGRRPADTASVANRMGWAAHRETSRPEDLAYCLMGIFNVNMPLLYGEGMSKAFFRLQEEIMKDSSDHTLFAWTEPDAEEGAEYGMLAPSPSSFARTNMIVPYEGSTDRAPHAWTNKGLSIELRLVPVHRASIKWLYQAVLNCPPPDFEEACYLTIYLKSTNFPLKRYTRVRASRLGRFRDGDAPSSAKEGAALLQQVYVKQTNRRITFPTDSVYPYHYFMLESNFRDSDMYKAEHVVVYPKGESVGPLVWLPDRGRLILIRRRAGSITAATVVTRKDGKKILVTFGAVDALRLAFDAEEIDESAPFPLVVDKNMPPPVEVLKEAFTPHELGETIELRNHRVRAELRDTELDFSQARSKTYKVKLCVEELEAPPSFEEVMSMDRKAELGLEAQPSGQTGSSQSGQSGDKGKGKARLSRLFGSSSKE